jgi:hypothetical protein
VVRATGLSTLPFFFSRLLKCNEVYGFAFTTVLFISAAIQAYGHLKWQLFLKAKSTLFLGEKNEVCVHLAFVTKESKIKLSMQYLKGVVCD